MRHMVNGQVAAEWFQLLWQADPTPLPSRPPFPNQSVSNLQRVHILGQRVAEWWSYRVQNRRVSELYSKVSEFHVDNVTELLRCRVVKVAELHSSNAAELQNC